jgi:predicted nuclease of restriction endonuclease-like (RecB) superfamily
MKRKAAAKKKSAVPRKKTPRAGISRSTAARISRAPYEPAFREIIDLIQQARQQAFRAVNVGLIDLYWRIGQRISQRIASDGWGKSTIVFLATYILRRDPNARGFSAQNLWRMRQFYETWRGEKKLSPLVRELTWTHNLLIMGKCKRSEEREFYLRLAAREHWGKRQLERQIDSALFERVALSPAKLSPAVRVLRPQAAEVFKDSYVVEFLQLPDGHPEADLHRGLVNKLKQFLIELGRDFCFVGSEFPIQVGGQDFSLDLLFFHRELKCLIAFDLKAKQFEPEHLGKMEFYLEALDRDVRKPHERPSIGVILCATKDNEVVEYSLSRSASPALIAEYQTLLPDKKLLRRKLHEFYQLALPPAQETKVKRPKRRKRTH